MKILEKIARSAASLLPLTPGEVTKRAGLYVHRPVLNAKAWHDWAVSVGVPDPVPPAEMHVTIVNSPINVNMKPDTQPYSMSMERAVVCMLGLKDDVLVVCFQSWLLYERNWDLNEAGALESFRSYRPHFTLSYAAAGYELPDDAMASMPEMVLLGAEVHSGSRMAEALAQSEMTEMDMAASVAMAMLEKGLTQDDFNLLEEYALRDATKTGKFTTFKGTEAEMAKRLAPPAEPAVDSVRKTVEREMTITVQALPEELRKSTQAAALFKANEEERLVIGWASVSSVKGQLVRDLQGDTITTKAQREFLHSLIRGQRGSTFEHIGEHCNEVVEGIIFDNDLQKALGIDLGMEGMLVVTYVPDDGDWEMVKRGDWMYSIAGTVLVQEDD